MSEDEDDTDVDIEGWEVPREAHIPVLLSGLQDADWELEEDERQP